MRLIDADLLAKTIEKAQMESRKVNVLSLIYDAPTVEYPFYAEAYQTGYEEGKNERPKGKWIVYKDNYGNDKPVCSCCNKEQVGYANYCSYCGRRMKNG